MVVDILGYEVGETCNRAGCVGTIGQYDSDGSCSCHVNPPCSYCTDSRCYCPVCDWDGREEQIEQDRVRYIKSKPRQYKTSSEVLRELYLIPLKDIKEVQWVSFPHTHFTMIKEGVFPKNTKRVDLAAQVQGTFGGRFELFSEEKQRFRFVAYTD